MASPRERREIPRAANGNRHFPSWPTTAWLLAAVLGITLFFHLWGIRSDLPYASGEPIFVACAREVAASGALHPTWLGFPGSTFIYPLAGIYRVWSVVHGGPLLGADPRLRAAIESSPAEFYLLGRVLTVVYALLSVIVVYRLGRDVFGERAAIIATLFAAFYPTDVFTKHVRPDSACVFFAMLAVWRCVRLFDRSSIANHIWAGVTVGLAISTKYTLSVIVLVLVLVDVLIVWRQRANGAGLKTAALGSLAGLTFVPLVFALTTPYFFLDFATARRDLDFELLRTTQPGAEGFSPGQNFLFYLSVLPKLISWPQLIAALLGIGVAIRQRKLQAMLLLAFAAVLALSISPHGLHWERWLIPILPVFALFAGSGVAVALAYTSGRLKLPAPAQAAALVFATALCCWSPVAELVEMDRSFARPSTNVVARQWITANLPHRSHLAFEWDTVPPPMRALQLDRGLWIARDGGRDNRELAMSHLAVRGSVKTYADQGYRYLITSSSSYNYYPTQPERFPREAAFYTDLLTQGHLLHEVSPAPGQRGPTIRIYEIRP